jgi:RNA polymerase sigma-32 factor
MRTHPPTADVVQYLREIRRFPLLESEEESLLAKRWREKADRQAVHRILTSHLRLVPNIARGYRGYGLPFSELISEGNIGLMQAAGRFDPERGARFSTYAVWWIKAAIQEYILRSWSLVRIGTTTAQRTLFFKLRQTKNRIAALHDRDMNADHAKLIAEHLRVNEQDVVEMSWRLEGDISLNTPIGDDDQYDEWQDRLVAGGPTQEEMLLENDELEHRHGALREALMTLGDRERYVLEMRRLVDGPLSLEVLASELGISRERVRQIEVRAFEKVCRAARSVHSSSGAAARKIASLNKAPAGPRAQRSAAKPYLSADIGAALCAD